MQLEGIRAPVTEDLKAIDRVVVDRLASDVALVNQVSQYIIGAAASACGR